MHKGWVIICLGEVWNILVRKQMDKHSTFTKWKDLDHKKEWQV